MSFRWLPHLGINFTPLGVYPLTGVLELFLLNFNLKVVEEQFPWWRFQPCCVFWAEECFRRRKLPFCYISLPVNLLSLYSWLSLCRWYSNFLINVAIFPRLILKMRRPYFRVICFVLDAHGGKFLCTLSENLRFLLHGLWIHKQTDINLAFLKVQPDILWYFLLSAQKGHSIFDYK